MEDHRYRELQASYLCVKSSVAEDLNSSDDFKAVLQYSGYSPSDQVISSYWEKNSHNGIAFEDYVSIASKLKETSAEDVASAFSKVFGSADAKVPSSEFRKLLTEKGNLSDANLDYILKEANAVTDDQSVDCSSLAKVILQTIDELKQLSLEKMEEKSNSLRMNSKTYTKRHHKTHSKAVSGTSWFTAILKGSFYVDHPSIISHQYCMNISQSGSTVVKIEAVNDSGGKTAKVPVIDVLAYIFKEGADGSRSYVGVTENVDSEGISFWQGELECSNYLIIPFTSGCYLPLLADSCNSELKLVTRDPNTQRISLTRQFRLLLTRIFDQLDLDSSGGLSRQEFNLYNWRTSGEEVQDDEWSVVQTNFTVHNNELTLEGFLDLHQLEAEDSGGVEDDLWLSLQAMGYNKFGQPVGCATYSVSVLSQVCNPSLQVSGLRSGGLLLDKAIVRHTMENSHPVRIKNMIDLIKYQFVGTSRTCVVLQNKSQRAMRIRVDASESSNILSHRGDLNVTLDLPARSAIVAHHLLPMDSKKPWKVTVAEFVL